MPKTKSEPVCPIVNLNGSNPQDLCDLYVRAMEAVAAAAEAVSQAYPHGRDYQLNPPGDLARATTEHQQRIESLALVHDELELVATNIVDQIAERDTRRRGR